MYVNFEFFFKNGTVERIGFYVESLSEAFDRAESYVADHDCIKFEL